MQQQQACVQNLATKDYKRAKLRCELCIQYDETVLECWNGLGLIELGQARNNLDVVYLRDDNFEKSLSFFRAAIAINLVYTDARCYYGLAMLCMGYKDMVSANVENVKNKFVLAKT